MGYAKAGENLCEQDVDNCLGLGVASGESFDPLCKGIYHCQKIFISGGGFGEGALEVQAECLKGKTGNFGDVCVFLGSRGALFELARFAGADECFSVV